MTDRHAKFISWNESFLYKISLNFTSTESCSVLYFIKQSHDRCKGELGPEFDPLKLEIVCDVKMQATLKKQDLNVLFLNNEPT